MWRLPRSDLKYRLTARVVAVSALCFVAIWTWDLIDTDRSARSALERIAGITARDLELQQSKADWLRSPHAEFPDLTNSAAALMRPGLCIAYRTNTGEVVQQFCSGAEHTDTAPPQLFQTLYQSLINPGHETVRTVLFRGRKTGKAVVWIDPTMITAQAWHNASRLFGLMVSALLLLSGLVYAALAAALRPTRVIREGLRRIAANDLSARLPPFDLAELSTIRAVFNQLAQDLEATRAERNELTRRLIGIQDDERRHLARELHDEFGQCLAAIRALAASVRQSAAQDCPSLLPECDKIAQTATYMMESLRGTLFRLRPPDIDELGLTASLEGLIAGWNGRSRDHTRFEITLQGKLDSVPAAFGSDLYRIAQEALTNAAKHAEATRIVLQLTARERHSTPGNGAEREIELSVSDDGQANKRGSSGTTGMGLLGMRERVAALGGHLTFETAESAGSVLRVIIPFVTPGEWAPRVECSA